jgi:PAS domain S-box-containing protein
VSKEVEILKRALERQKKARMQAERILEDKSLELYNATRELERVNNKLENLLKEKTSQIQGFFENINDAYLIMDLEGNVIKMNDVAEDFFEFTLANENVNVVDLIYRKDYEYAMNSFAQLIEKGRFADYNARIITKNGNIKWVHINASIVYNSENVPIAAQGIIRDVTVEIESKNLLKESENRLSSLLLNLDSAVLLEDENRKIIFTNKKFCEIFNIPIDPVNLVGMDCTDSAENSKHLFKDPDGFVKNINHLLDHKKQVLGEEIIMKNGTILERDFIPIISKDIYKGHFWTYKNITLKKRYNQIIELEKEKYSNIIANMNLGLLEVNTKKEIIMCNNSFCKMSGYSIKELSGKLLKDVFGFENQDIIFKPEINKIKTDSFNSNEIEIKNKHGEIKNWLMSSAPNYNLKGELIGSIGVYLDITQLKFLENQKTKILSSLEKSNEELKEYAHIVSHDLKSPLRSISALTAWIKMDNLEHFDKDSLQNFDDIDITLEKMESLISDVLKFSSLDSKVDEEHEVDLDVLVKEVIHMLYIPNKITINVKNTLPKIKGDKVKFQQLFQNLIGNAIKFNDKENGFININVEEQKSFYKFTIKDNGIGIEKKNFDKIFKIFQSLKKSENSSGIGLSIVKKIIDIYKGEIWLESEINKGTTFHFTLKK